MQTRSTLFPALLCVLYATFECRVARAEGSAPVIAVFNIEDARPPKQRLSADELRNLTEYLATKLSSSGAFKIVPTTQLRAAIAEKKKETFGACFDSGCQIEIGKELAAQKSLSTRIIIVGKECVVISTLYDLREAASERSADQEGGCDGSSLGAALKVIAAKLASAPDEKTRAPEESTRAAEPATPKTEVLNGARVPGGMNPKVVIKTSMGSIVAEIYRDKAPITAANFLRYVEERFYDGTTFHRVIPSFMIQGGGYDAGLKLKETHAPIKSESMNGLGNEVGTLATARAGDPDTANSQFFINTIDNSRLNYVSPSSPGYSAVFGRVLEGMDVVAKISAVTTTAKNGMSDVPAVPVVIESIRLLGP